MLQRLREFSSNLCYNRMFARRNTITVCIVFCCIYLTFSLILSSPLTLNLTLGNKFDFHPPSLLLPSSYSQTEVLLTLNIVYVCLDHDAILSCLKIIPPLISNTICFSGRTESCIPDWFHISRIFHCFGEGKHTIVTVILFCSREKETLSC
jgi:hypothetical protein